MQVDWLHALVRLALYLDLMLLFGLPLFHLLFNQSSRQAPQRAATMTGYATWMVAAAVAGIVLSCLGMAIMTKAMTGAPDYASVSTEHMAIMVTGTGFGHAWTARLMALLASIACALLLRRWPGLQSVALTLAGAVALATVAWAGHGAMDEDTRGLIHLFIDISHLLAAGAWVGSLVAFVLLGRAARADAASAALLSRSALAFAHLGTLIVATLVITGAGNYWLIAGMPSIAAALTPYGMVLAAKLLMFAAMLGMAARNRYRLAPALATALGTGDQPAALHALRRSLRSELFVAIIVLLAVAVLGMMSPES